MYCCFSLSFSVCIAPYTNLTVYLVLKLGCPILNMTFCSEIPDSVLISFIMSQDKHPSLHLLWPLDLLSTTLYTNHESNGETFTAGFI